MKGKIVYIGVILGLLVVGATITPQMLYQTAKAGFTPEYEADVIASDIVLTTWPITTHTDEKFKAEIYNDGPDTAAVRVKFKFDGTVFATNYIYDLASEDSAFTDEVTRNWPNDFQCHAISIEVSLISGGYDPDGDNNGRSEDFRALFPGN